MRKEVLQDEMIFNCFRALQNNMTDFDGFCDDVKESLIKNISIIDNGCDEECVLVVEVVA